MTKYVLRLLASGLKLSQSLGEHFHDAAAEAGAFVGDIAAKCVQNFLIADWVPRCAASIDGDFCRAPSLVHCPAGL